MTNIRHNVDLPTTALEDGTFPVAELSQIAEQESWRKEINRPMYHIHKWWATRLGSVFRGLTLGALSKPRTHIWEQFYKRHDFADKVVLDPFMGSGTTLGEAVKLGAKAIGSDINPMSTFLVRQAFTRVSEEQLRAAFAKLEVSVAPEVRRYYQTRDLKTGAIIPALYYFWVKTVTTPTGETIALFSKYVFAQDAYAKQKPKAQIVCPHCWAVIEDRFDTISLTCNSCNATFNPQQGPAAGQYVNGSDGKRYRIKDLLPTDGSPPKHRLYAIMALGPNGEKVYQRPTDEDRALFDEAEQRLRSEDLPLPRASVRPGHNTDQARSYQYNYWRDFFNARQLLCLGLLLREIMKIEDVATQEQLLCLFSSTLEFNNMFCSFKGEGTGAVRHMFSNHILKPERTPLENSVWGTDRSSGTFCTLFESRLLRAKRYLDEPFELAFSYDLFGKRVGSVKTVASAPINSTRVGSWTELVGTDKGIMILNGDSAHLAVPDQSVDAVITDPPYFDFVHYSELSDFFFAWIAPVLKSRYPWFGGNDSSANGEVQHENPREFARRLGAVFAECARVLKPEGVLAFSFHHSRPEGWAAIYEALTLGGLSVVAAHPLYAELRAANPKSAAKSPITLDAILVCRKRSSVNGPRDSKPTDSTIDCLEQAGFSLSAGDRFVVAAAAALVARGCDSLSYEKMEAELERVYRNIDRATPDSAATAISDTP